MANYQILVAVCVCLCGAKLGAEGGRSEWTFVDYFKFGKEAYLANDWKNCDENFNLAIEDYRYYKQVVLRCKKVCRAESKEYAGTKSGGKEKYLEVFETFVNETLCLMRCKRKGFESDNSPITDCSFAQMTEYAKAADAAFTYHILHPNSDIMLSNIHYYINSPGVVKDNVINLENLKYTKYFMDAAQYYRDESWQQVIDNMEQVIPKYLESEEDCRFDCEKPFDMGWFPDFITSVANHFTFCLRCKLKCPGKLENLDGEVIEGLFPLTYHYLQIGYFKVGDLKSAAQCVESYLLFYPEDEDMTLNREYYQTKEGADPSWFQPWDEVVQYFNRLKHEKALLSRIDESFKEFESNPDFVESKALEAPKLDEKEEVIIVEDYKPTPPPMVKFEL
ncbi:hypothetical protein TCAL_08913 [Tigriopus californicus]|uniref:Leprecan-like alpha-helical domain-containing protein n=1 Tax=Tigriopus californicus TaxID=6832 RepID=A0A553P017_TIGCA|nr:hypothetical protein TCAL_08913 [Tigriopus californicus]